MDYNNSKAEHKPAAMNSNKNREPKANVHSWVNKDIPSAYLFSETFHNNLQKTHNNLKKPFLGLVAIKNS